MECEGQYARAEILSTRVLLYDRGCEICSNGIYSNIINGFSMYFLNV